MKNITHENHSNGRPLTERLTHRIGVVGLGYVGAPLAFALASHFDVIGFDIDLSRVAELRAGLDRTNELEAEKFLTPPQTISHDLEDLKACDILIVTVPTPVGPGNVPDLGPIRGACQMLAKVMKKGCIVVFESTVYPGVTLDICVPLLEEGSGGQHRIDFFVGYSPERINPGDKVHTLHTTTKIVSGDTPQTLATLDKMYGAITKTYCAPSIPVAEAAKVIENTQRDVNIALMNELSQLLNRLNIDTQDVLAAAGTKWNFINFHPGLVGGHCISVDPYYLSHTAAAHGFIADLILASRAVNDSMPKFVAQELIRLMSANLSLYQKPVVTILGVTFKENVPDVRNSKVAEIFHFLTTYGVLVQVIDPYASAATVETELGIHLTNPSDAIRADAILVAVPHSPFLSQGWGLVTTFGKIGTPLVVLDLKAALPRHEKPPHVHLWRP